MKKFRLPNGLTVLVERQPWAMGLSIGIWVKVGTRHEEMREAGISHFLEHMVFKGTTTRRADEITRAVERVGGEFNAFTSREYTCFHITLLNRDFELGMEVLSDVVLSSTFVPEELEREKKVILQEIATVEESPEEQAGDVFFERIYGRHGLGRSILGSANSVRKMRRRDLLRVFRDHYRPSNIVISIVGDVTLPRVRKTLAALGKKNWPGRRPDQSGGRDGPPSIGKPAPKIREGFWWKVRPTEQAHVVWGVPSPKYTHRDQPVILLLASYLGGGMSSHLFQEIREKHGLAYSVYTNVNSFIDSGVFAIYAATPVKHVASCLKLIEESTHRMCTTLLSDETLSEVKESLKGTLLLSCDSVESVMQANAVDEIYFGRTFTVGEVCADLDRVTPRDVQRVSRKIFGAASPSTLVYGPRPSPATRKKLRPSILKN